jgi:ABC-type nickel/cobalt efflux system permease component RcnA
LNATAKTMCGAEKAIEIASYALIAAFGARLVWTKGGSFIGALQVQRPVPAMAAVAPHGHHHHDHDDGQDHVHGHVHDHVHDAHGGHSHGPVPSELSGPGGWRSGFAGVRHFGTAEAPPSCAASGWILASHAVALAPNQKYRKQPHAK